MDLEQIRNLLSQLPAEAKKLIYEEGRQTSIESKGIKGQIVNLFSKSNIPNYLAIIGILITLYWSYYNIVRPIIQLVSPLQRQENVYAPAKTSYKIFNNEDKPAKCNTKIVAKTTVVENGKEVKKEIPMWVEGTPEIFVQGKDSENVEVQRYNSMFNWQLQFGIGFVVVPEIDNRREIVSPAIFISPLEIYQRVNLDAYFNHLRAGGGVSCRLPWKYTRNTFIGIGASLGYSKFTEPAVTLYGKINF